MVRNLDLPGVLRWNGGSLLSLQRPRLLQRVRLPHESSNGLE